MEQHSSKAIRKLKSLTKFASKRQKRQRFQKCRIKGWRLYRRLPISTAIGGADSIRAFRKSTKQMSHNQLQSTKDSINHSKALFILANRLQTYFQMPDFSCALRVYTLEKLTFYLLFMHTASIKVGRCPIYITGCLQSITYSNRMLSLTTSAGNLKRSQSDRFAPH